MGSDMLVYYVEGDLKRSVVPDVWVTFGVPKLPERRTWLTWLEGKGPDFVLEITSKSTKREDEVSKKTLYEELGVKECWQFDPTGDYLDPILKGRELGPNGKYRELALRDRDGVLCHSSLLGLELCLEGGRLFYFDPVRNARLLTSADKDDAILTAEAERDLEARLRREETAARHAAELERDLEIHLRRKEAAARHAAEARVAELERRLRAK